MVFLGTIGAAAAHGAMVSPAPRNAIDSELPAWDHGKHAPQTGVIEPLSVGCTNGTEPCAVGQSVFWFSQVSFQSGFDHEPALTVWVGLLLVAGLHTRVQVVRWQRHEVRQLGSLCR